MARLRDVPSVFKQIGIVTFAKRVWQQITEDAVFTWGAALAYSWMFAIFPFLILLLSLVPMVPQQLKFDAHDNIAQLVNETLPQDAGTLVMKQVDSVLERPSASGFFSFGLILTIWASSGGMAMTMTALDKAYDIEKGRPYLKQRGIAILLTIVVATLLILVMVLLPIGTGIINWLGHHKNLGWTLIFVNVARYALALLLMLTTLALIYHFGPSFRQKFHAVTPGAIFSLAVWLLLGAAFKIYLTKFGGAASYNKTYGAVAGAAIMLLFFYIDALVLLIGAEINSEIDFAVLGIRSGATPEAQATVETEATHEPEQKALAAELEALRKPDAMTPSTPSTAQQKPGGSMLHTLILAGAGVWAASNFGKKMRQASIKRQIDPRPEPQRLRETYPLTYELIKHEQTNGHASAECEDGADD
jgi:membrane protein